jgi:hypothetical protein
MTLVKRPMLERQRNLLGFEPRVSLEDGVRRVCAVQARMAALERVAHRPGTNGDRPVEPVDRAKTLEPLLPPLTLPSAAV